MKLRDLEATFIQLKTQCDESGNWDVIADHPTLDQAQGVRFLCPLCFAKNNGRVGTHQVICWFKNKGVPDEVGPAPGRWNPSGTGLDDLTFVPPGATSVLLLGGCQWHGFVNNGDAA